MVVEEPNRVSVADMKKNLEGKINFNVGMMEERKKPIIQYE